MIIITKIVTSKRIINNLDVNILTVPSPFFLDISSTKKMRSKDNSNILNEKLLSKNKSQYIAVR